MNSDLHRTKVNFNRMLVAKVRFQNGSRFCNLTFALKDLYSLQLCCKSKAVPFGLSDIEMDVVIKVFLLLLILIISMSNDTAQKGLAV